MNESFDAYRYIGYLRARWRWIASSAALAVVLAAAASLAMTPQYTATARVVIEPPAGADLRAAMAVSPIYLESLKTYERFADSDSLFQKAVRQFGLQGGPIESLKRRVLQVQLVRNTRILEIAATLPDPQKAQALAKFLAEATVETNRASVAEGDQDLLHGIEQQARELRARLQETDANWAKAVAGEHEKEQRQNSLHTGEHGGIDKHSGGKTWQQGRAADEEDQQGDGREESAV